MKQTRASVAIKTFQLTSLFVICQILALVAISQPASAVVFRTWNGSTDGLWSTVANWSGGSVPTNTDVIQFDGVLQLNNTNDLVNVTNSGFIFLPTAGAFTINSTVQTLDAGDLNNQSTNVQTFNAGLQITGGNRNILAHNGNNNVGNLVFKGPISQDVAGRAVTFAQSPGNFQTAQGQGTDGGNVTLTAANTYSGATSLGVANGNNGANGGATAALNNTGFGTLKLDFSAAGAPTSDILYNGVATPGNLNMNSARLLIQGAAGVNNTNRFGNLVYDIGENIVQLVAGSGGTVTATFGTIGGLDANNSARAGLVNFILGANTKVTTTSANNATTGILASSGNSAHIIVNGTDWAANDGSGNVVAYTGYLVDGVGTLNANVDLFNSTNLTAGVIPSTIRFNQPVDLILSNNIGAAMQGGTILMTANVGAHTNIITGTGSLYNNAGTSIAYLNYDTNANSALIIQSPFGIGNQGEQNTFGGPGLIMLTATTDNRNGGTVSIIGKGRLSILSNTNLGTPSAQSALSMDDGTLIVNSTFALDNNNGGGLNARQVALSNKGGTFDVGGTNTLTISGTVGSTGGSLNGGSLSKVGNGTLLLKGATISYAGTTFIKKGTLVIATAPSGTGAIVVNDGAALTDQGSVSIKPSRLDLGSSTGCTNSFTGVSSTTIAPIATTTLNANGTTTLNVSGSLTAGSVYPLISFVNNVGTGNFIVGTLPLGVAANIVTNNGTNIALNVISTGNPDVWKGNVNNNWNIAATANWFVNNSIVYNDGDLVRFDDTASQFNVNVAANVAPGGITVTNQLNAYTFSGTNNIGGSGGLLKTGTNTLTIGVNYTGNGGITVNSGTLVIGDGNTNGAVTASAITDNGAVIFNRADTNASFSAGISGSGSVTIDGLTNGILAYGGNNSYLGDTTIKSGMLNAGGSGCVPALAGGGNLVVQSSGIMDVSADLITVNGLFGNGVVDNLEAFPDPNFNGLNFTVGANNTNSTFAGTIQDAVGRLNLVKTGSGTLFLTGTNTFIGTIQFNAGILNVASLGDYGTPSAIGNRPIGEEVASNNRIGLWFRGGTLQYTGADPQSCNRNIRLFNGTHSIDASGSNPNATLYFSWGDQVGANINLFENPGTRTMRFTGSNTGANVFSIQLLDQAANATSVIKDGVGSWYLVGGPGQSYSGSTTVSNGLLVISTTHNTTTPTGGASGSFIVNNGATLGVTDGANAAPALMGALTLGNGGATTLMFTNIPAAATSSMISSTGTVVNGTCTIVCSTNNLVAGTTYPLLTYGTLSGGFTLASMPGPLYYKLTNDAVNIALVASATPFVALNPTNITVSVTGNQLTLSWPADHLGWTLQTNSVGLTATSSWVPLPGSASVTSEVITINPSNTNVFYRLVYP